jgi:hypothetical protein
VHTTTGWSSDAEIDDEQAGVLESLARACITR